jgi:peptidyl-prolyl cis-trans isomerase A (cyclophilin A)
MLRCQCNMWMCVIGVCGLFATGAGGAVSPATQPTTTKAAPALHAVCIGIGTYPDAHVKPLTKAQADAQRVANVLKTRYGVAQPTVLLGAKATRAAIFNTVATLGDARQVSPDDAVVVYVTGRAMGLIAQGKGSVYLLGHDAGVDATGGVAIPDVGTMLSLDALADAVKRIPAKHALIVFDGTFGAYGFNEAPDPLSALTKSLGCEVIVGARGATSLAPVMGLRGDLTTGLLRELRQSPKPMTAVSLAKTLRAEAAVRYLPGVAPLTLNPIAPPIVDLSAELKAVTEAMSAAALDPKPRVAMATSKGTIVLELDAVQAPDTVANFLQYVDDGFYNGTVFHRVIPNFMIQGGGMDPGLAKKSTRSPIRNEASNGLSNARGTIAMARTSHPHSATSQFFINLAENRRLDYPGAGGGYCVFGRVVEGMDVVDAIARVQTTTKTSPGMGPYQNVPVETVTIISITRQ